MIEVALMGAMLDFRGATTKPELNAAVTKFNEILRPVLDRAYPKRRIACRAPQHKEQKP